MTTDLMAKAREQFDDLLVTLEELRHQDGRPVILTDIHGFPCEMRLYAAHAGQPRPKR